MGGEKNGKSKRDLTREVENKNGRNEMLQFRVCGTWIMMIR